MKRSIFLIAALSSLSTLPAHATDLGIDSVSIEAGHSSNDNGDVNMGRIGVQWDWGVKWFETSSMFLGGYWDAQAGYWHSSDSDIGDFSITPVFRLQSSATSGFVPYAEFAVGAHMLTEKTITNGRVFSTNFQFGDHIGAGFRFGEKAEYDIGYRYQHLSNASIDSPNPGINFHQIRFSYHF
jgi:hypothetical protein